MSWLITPNQKLDPDAAIYIDRVQAADGQSLETPVQSALNTFVLGCKADGIWNAIKASCILAGARTLSGALVPLVGAAPTNFNFVSADYSNKTGLMGNRTTKYIDTNRASNIDPRDNLHCSIYLSSAGTTNQDRGHLGNTYVSANNDLTDIVALNDGRLIVRNRNDNTTSGGNLFSSPAGSQTGFIGSSRSNATSYQIRRALSTSTHSSGLGASSLGQGTANFHVFRANLSPSIYSDARIAFYSIGESLNLALLDTRVTALINALTAAIP